MTPTTPTLDERINDILDEILEPNADDETPEGTILNYRTLVLHDSEFQARQEEAKTAIKQAVYAALVEQMPKKVAANIGSSANDVDWGVRMGQNNMLDEVLSVLSAVLGIGEEK